MHGEGGRCHGQEYLTAMLPSSVTATPFLATSMMLESVMSVGALYVLEKSGPQLQGTAMPPERRACKRPVGRRRLVGW